MGKIYNVQLNSFFGTQQGSAGGSSITSYNIDWANLLPDKKKFKLTFAFMSSLNYGNNFSFPYITTNLLGHSYRPATNGFQNAYYLGHLRVLPVISPTTISLNPYVQYTSDVNDNPPIYLEKRPAINDLRVSILKNYDVATNTSGSEFVDNYLSVSGAGTCTQSGFILSVASLTAGQITIGTVITPTALAARTVVGFIGGTGNTSQYIVSLSATIAAATNFTFPADTTQVGMSPYILNLSFEELDE